MQKSRRSLHCLVLLILLSGLTLLPAAPAFSAIQATASVQKALDKLLAQSDASAKTAIRSSYSKFTQLQQEDAHWENKVKQLHQKNSSDEQQLRKQISAVHSAKINALKQQSAQTRTRYKALFESYTLLNKQLAAARQTKNKTVIALLRNQTDLMRPAVQIARADIRNKDAAVKAARQAADQIKSKAKKSLASLTSHKETVKRKNQAISAKKKKLAEDWKSVTAAIRQGSGAAVLKKLEAASATSSQLLTLRSELYNTESAISTIITHTRSQLPAN